MALIAIKTSNPFGRVDFADEITLVAASLQLKKSMKRPYAILV